MSTDYLNPQNTEIGRYFLRITSYAHPEQYDVYKAEVQVAYMRLRHGLFTVSIPDSNGQVILELKPDGDGQFTGDEREAYLRRAVSAIQENEFGMEQ